MPEQTGEGLIWERPEPSGRTAPTSLSRGLIVVAAIGLADGDGLAGVSLRKVAEQLDTGAMRLYGYVATKDELLDLMVDAVYQRIPVDPPTKGGWQAALRQLAGRTRRVALQHEWFADLMGGRPHLGPGALAHLEAVLAALADGLPDADAVRQAAAVHNAWLVGAVRTEVAERRAARASGLDEHAWRAAAGPYLGRMLDTGRYPALAEVVRDTEEPSREQVFAAGQDCVLAGIAARFAR